MLIATTFIIKKWSWYFEEKQYHHKYKNTQVKKKEIPMSTSTHIKNDFLSSHHSEKKW